MKEINGHKLKSHKEGDRAGGTTYYTCKNDECEFYEHSSKLHLAKEFRCPAKQADYVEIYIPEETEKTEETKKEVGDGFVVRDWIKELPWKQQTVLLSAIRGCDGVSKHDPSKAFIRPFRGVVLNNAEPGDESDTFMHHPEEEEVEDFAHDLDDYPMHWLVHFMHAAEIIGFKHPDDKTREWWMNLYEEMVSEGFHLNPEIEEQLDRRLQP